MLKAPFSTEWGEHCMAMVFAVASKANEEAMYFLPLDSRGLPMLKRRSRT